MIDDSLNDTQQLIQSKGYQDALREGLEAVAKAQQEKTQMSVQELKLNCHDEIKFRKSDQGFEVIVNGNINWFDRSQAHLLMLYLQEHLGYVSISKDRLDDPK